MVSNILDSNVTYSSLINSAADSLYNRLKNETINNGTVYRDNIVNFSIGAEVNGIGAGNQRRDVTLNEKEIINETYTPPSKNTIINDITKFMSANGIPTDNTNPTPDGVISFIFALNFFVEKAIIKRAIESNNNTSTQYHLHYKVPTSSYYKLPYNYSTKNTITTNKINDIYTHLKTTSLLSDNARSVNIASGSHTSSSSSSSCSSSSSSSCSSSSSSSSSSCSSSSSIFIAYFNLI